MALSPSEAAARIDALQRGRTSRDDERAILDVFRSFSGRALTELKNEVDAGGDHRDLLQLVFHDIDDCSIREELLAHFESEAAGAPSGELKVLSDIDDTVYANWIDERYPKKTIYPGVVTFYDELDRGALAAEGRRGDVTFITARPSDRIGLSEGFALRTLRSLGFSRAVVLTGSISRILTNRAIASKKVENFLQYRRTFPEYRFVFVGDSGQGDVVAGEEMQRHMGQAVVGVFIHDVVSTPEDERDRRRSQGIFLFDTYAGAAAQAMSMGLVSPEGAARTARAASGELSKVTFMDAAQRERRRAELCRDVERLNGLLPEGLRVSPPPA